MTTTANTPTVLFVCVRNGGKSQMAAALMRMLAGDSITVHSAGTDPGDSLNAEAEHSIAARGATFEGEFPKALDPAILEGADRVIVLGSEAQLPRHHNSQVETWDIDEPSLRGISGTQRMDLIREDIYQRVQKLYQQLL